MTCVPAIDAAVVRADTVPDTSLSAIIAVTIVSGVERSAVAPRRNGRRSSSAVRASRLPRGCGRRRAAAPTHPEVDQLKSARPAHVSVAGPAGTRPHGRDPGVAERIEERVGHRHVRRLVSAPQTHVGPAEARSSTAIPSRPTSSTGAGSTTVSGAPTRAARRRITGSASPLAPVTARSPAR
jgi:hypothetical protein